MKKMETLIKRIIMLSLVLAIFSSCIVSNAVFSKSKANEIYSNVTIPTMSAKAFATCYGPAGKVVVESSTSRDHLSVGNMIKLMTLYLAFEAIANGKTTLDSKFIVSADAQKISLGRERVYLDAGKKEKISVAQAITAITVGSANDAAYALAQHISGSTEAAFVDMMNAKAKEFGLEDTNFLDSTGIKILSDGQYSCAKDIAVIGYHLVNDFPDVLDFTKLTSGVFEHTTTGAEATGMVSSNALISSGMMLTCDGLLVGYSKADLYAQCATAEINDERVVAVVIGEETPELRAGELKYLLEYTASHFDMVETGEIGTYVRRVSVKDGKSLKLKTCTGGTLSYLYSTSEKPEIDVQIIVDDNIVAPVEQGQKVGYIKYLKITKNADGEEVIEEIGTVDLLAQESVEKASWFILFIRKILSFLGIGEY